jgi:cyclohexyl-isocyanide hydratase
MLVGVPIYQGFNLLDVAGPIEMFHWAGWKTVLVAARDPKSARLEVTSINGVTISSATAFTDAAQFDVLWTPGGDPDALTREMNDPQRTYLDFLIRQAAKAKYVCSVCEGALLMARAGLFDGYKITTHWYFKRCFGRFPEVKLAPGYPRFWWDRNRLTGGGISSGLDEALELIGKVDGVKAAKEVQRTTQYYPEPPVKSGLPKVAPLCPITPLRTPPAPRRKK